MVGTLVACGGEEVQTERVSRSPYEWNGWLFSGSTEQYNADLAVVAAKLCQDVYSKEGILAQLDAYGFDGCEGYNYSKSDSLGRFDGTNCFVIGHDVLTINGKETTVLCVIVRGTYGLDADKEWYYSKSQNLDFDFVKIAEKYIGEIMGDFFRGELTLTQPYRPLYGIMCMISIRIWI